MDLNDLRMQARMLMTAHGVGSLGFELSGTKRAIATCHGVYHVTTEGRRLPLATKISFSKHWGLAMDAEDCRNVMLHEIAHALTMGHDHDYVFMAKCHDLGTPANRTCYLPKADISYLWTSRCPAGHDGPKMHRAPGIIRSCSKCQRGFNFDHVLSWYRSGKLVELNDMPVKYQKVYRYHSDRAMLRVALKPGG